jgi:hypothetical protein
VTSLKFNNKFGIDTSTSTSTSASGTKWEMRSWWDVVLYRYEDGTERVCL